MLSLPNLLTLSRILAVPILVFLLWRPAPLDYAITFVLYCIVGITDYFDGYLARAQGQISRLGQFLDPIADKIMVARCCHADLQPQGERRCRRSRAAHHPRADHPAARDHRLGPARIPRRRSTCRCRSARSPSGRRRFQLVALGALILGGAVPDEPWVHKVGLASLWARRR
jgi:cardiolipin synthase